MAAVRLFWGVGFRVSWFRVPGPRVGSYGAGSRVRPQGSESGFRVQSQGSGFRVQIQGSESGFRVHSKGFTEGFRETCTCMGLENEP